MWLPDDEFLTQAFLARLHVANSVATARAEAYEALREYKLAQEGKKREPIQRSADLSGWP